MRKNNTLMLSMLLAISSMPNAFSNAGPAGPAPQPAPAVAPGCATAVPYMYVYDTPYVFYKNEMGNTEVSFGARVKADFYYDVDGKQPGTTFGLDDNAIPLKNWDPDAKRKGNFNASATASRFSFGVKQKWDNVLADGYAEVDFNGGLASGVRTSTNYLPRIRHFYGKLADQDRNYEILIGQTWNNFSTPDVNSFTANNVPPAFRNVQVRGTFKIVPCLFASVSLEKPNTQYYQFTTPAATGTNGYFDDDSGFSKNRVPDLTAKVQYYKGTTLLAVRGVVRRQEMKVFNFRSNGSNANYHKTKTAWGLGASAMFKIFEPLAFMGQVQGGKGIGRYIDDLANQNPFDSYFQYSTGASHTPVDAFSLFKAINFIGGFTVTWCKPLETNIGGAYTRIHLPKNAAFTTSAVNLTSLTSSAIALPTRQLQRYFVNLVWKPVEKNFFILEAEHYRRKAGHDATFKGHDTRIVFSFIRNF